MQQVSHKCNHRRGGHNLTFHAKPRGSQPAVLSIFWGFLCSI